tara:strand:+ start:211 stop:1515 length:1305 start_codon:yes stop_codon:yes gene_type:complete
MDKLNIDSYLERHQERENIINILKEFEEKRTDLLHKKGIYIYGNPGTGKTKFVENILKELNYDIIKYDAGDIRNKSIIEMITMHNMSDTNVLSLLQKKARRIAIIMDEIDGMNNGDKGGINSLIKLIRPKKTKKQKKEDVTYNPIICIGNYHMDKKIKELMKVCNTIELKTPTNVQINNALTDLMPKLAGVNKDTIVDYIQGDLRKLISVLKINKNKPDLLTDDVINKLFKKKAYNEDTKQITKKLINDYHHINDHAMIMNETDRTIVGLLWHENIVDVLSKFKKDESFPFYSQILDNICFADYIDRITFQKQIWQFNEISSLIKTFYNNTLYHQTFTKKPTFNPAEVRFTKVLTKYSTEFNNTIFIQSLCQQLGMDKKDMYSFFIHIRETMTEEEITELFENYEITRLDINRINKFLDNFNSELIENESGEDD